MAEKKINLTMDDFGRIGDALNLKMREWAQAPVPDELKRGFIFGYQDTLKKIEAFVNAEKPKPEPEKE
jgi:hypothetical protein